MKENYVVSDEKIVNALEEPIPIKDREGLLRMFESFRLVLKV